MYKTVLLDISGVLYQGNAAIPGAIQAVQRLRNAGAVLRFVTNTSRQPAAALLKRLHGLGFGIALEELFTAPQAARRWLIERHHRPLLIIHPELEPEFADLAQHNPDAVLLADAEERLNYAYLDQAFALLMAGAPLLAIGENRYFQGADRLHLDAGPFVRALEYAAGVRAQVAGKPSPLFFQQALAEAGGQACDTLMVGDDVQADVLGALDAGLHACLVRTGKYRQGDERTVSGRARVESSLASLVEHLGL
ncbi:TIGR01458 family HAD-type hydrolase [Marinobacter sp. SS21]|uniref:TIGR01458 family HAD-type hydrolase n=1 Tax=Marinobacter sp. SS21 TaxID=2979460 RepID=UPI00232BF3DA|nr:TIGR01458 family HAD-type hydrolase [Marinobacter sp. SS21]MDC0661419.1 TIGR01458 family HAD-type hydrolase [Marinobacter sp. SS21]